MRGMYNVSGVIHFMLNEKALINPGGFNIILARIYRPFNNRVYESLLTQDKDVLYPAI